MTNPVTTRRLVRIALAAATVVALDPAGPATVGGEGAASAMPAMQPVARQTETTTTTAATTTTTASTTTTTTTATTTTTTASTTTTSTTATTTPSTTTTAATSATTTPTAATTGSTVPTTTGPVLGTVSPTSLPAGVPTPAGARSPTRAATAPGGERDPVVQARQARARGGVVEPAEPPDLAQLLDDRKHRRSRPAEKSTSGLFLGGLITAVGAGVVLGARDRAGTASPR